MKRFIVKRIKEKIDLNGQDYADAYVALKAYEGLDTPDAKKTVDTANHTMKTIEERLVFLRKLLKEESK